MPFTMCLLSTHYCRPCATAVVTIPIAFEARYAVCMNCMLVQYSIKPDVSETPRAKKKGGDTY